MDDRTTVCVAGGGPAGMVLGLLLARAGIDVTVLEKHGDFLRDFRGDTVHPTTLDLLDDLGLGEKFDELPYSRVDRVGIPYRHGMATIADLSRLRGKRNYIAMVPQWDFLDLLADAAREEPSFSLRMNTEATAPITENGRVTGVEYRTSDGGTGRIHADLVVAADGRHSTLRRALDLPVTDFPTPMDVWWFRLPKHDTDTTGVMGVISRARASVMIDRRDYWQCAVLIRKGTDPRLRSGPVSEVVRGMADAVPFLADRVDALSSWDEVKLLDVKLDRLNRWYTDGLLCIGDAAHAMSPVGGVGINLAVQDAVATARLLAEPLRRGRPTTADLARVQRRRIVPTRLVQAFQRLVHAKGMVPALSGRVEIAKSDRLPLPMRLLQRFPALRAIPAYLVGRGVMTEKAPGFARR